MKRITLIQTFDGKTHFSTTEAERHLDHLLGHALCALARKVVETGKYKDALRILEEGTEAMRTILQIRDDMTLETEEENE